jgi:ABC-type sugar transport system substrate-binding protein
MMPKLIGISYFEATERGALEAAAELNIELKFDGPTEARAEDQAKLLDSWVAQGLDVIAIAPNDPESISRNLRAAGELGVTVLTWDTDANPTKSARSIFVNQSPNSAIGEALVDVMAEGVAKDGASLAGKYLIVSGTPTAANQNIWMEHMKARIAEKYPEIELLPHLTPGEDHFKSREQTGETIAAHPDLKGVWGITSVALPAVADAVRDAGKAGEIYVTGLSLPDTMREFVHDGTVEKFVLWDAVDLGYLTVQVAKHLAEQPLVDGTYDFGRLHGIEVRDGEVILGPPLIFDRGNIDKFNF